MRVLRLRVPQVPRCQVQGHPLQFVSGHPLQVAGTHQLFLTIMLLSIDLVMLQRSGFLKIAKIQLACSREFRS